LRNYGSNIIILNTTLFGDRPGRTCTANSEAAVCPFYKGLPSSWGPHFDFPKTVKSMLIFIKLFVLTGLSTPYVLFHVTEILAWI
jgi:hypothetical protein